MYLLVVFILKIFFSLFLFWRGGESETAKASEGAGSEKEADSSPGREPDAGLKPEIPGS